MLKRKNAGGGASFINVPKAIVDYYNLHMGGVDASDQMRTG